MGKRNVVSVKMSTQRRENVVKNAPNHAHPENAAGTAQAQGIIGGASI
jgi:hypothetical protein